MKKKKWKIGFRTKNELLTALDEKEGENRELCIQIVLFFDNNSMIMY